jgi:hypothetical protein
VAGIAAADGCGSGWGVSLLLRFPLSPCAITKEHEKTIESSSRIVDLTLLIFFLLNLRVKVEQLYLENSDIKSMSRQHYSITSIHRMLDI